MSKLSDENIQSLKSLAAQDDDEESFSSNKSQFWIGLDGTKNGWSVCILDQDGKVELYFISTLNDLWFLYSKEFIHSIAIDMPLALSQKAIRGGRGCEREGRRLLMKSKQNSSIKQKGNNKSQIPFVGPSSIFTPPCRIALEAFENGASHSETSEINKNSIFDNDSDEQSSPPNSRNKRQKRNGPRDSTIGLGLSIQAYNIMPKIVELDKFVSNGIQEDLFYFYPKDHSNSEKIFLFECHPELAFLSLSAKTRKDLNSLENLRALKTKKSAIGRRERLSLLFNFPNLINKCSLIHSAAKNTITDEILNRLIEDKLSFQTSWSISHISSSSSSSTKKYENLVSIPSDDVIDSIVCAMIAKRLSGKGEDVISITDSIDEKDTRGIPMTIFV